MALALYVDEDSCGRRFIQALRRFGLDVLTTAQAGRLSHDDQGQLEFAASVSRVLVTANDGDFSRLQSSWAAAAKEHAGIIVVRQRAQSPEAAAQAVYGATAALAEGALANGIIHV